MTSEPSKDAAAVIDAAAPGYQRPAKQGGGLPLLRRRVRRVLRERRKPLLTGMAVSAALAVVLAYFLTQYTWEAKGALLYTPLPVPETQKGIYTPSALKTYLALVKSEENLKQLAAEFELPVPLHLLDSQFKVELATSTEVILVSFKWGERGQTVAMANRLMELFIQQVTSIRQQRLAANAADLEDDLRNCKRRAQQANEALQDFKIKDRVVDPRGTLDRIQGEMLTMENTLVTVRRNQNNYRVQLQKLEKHIADLKNTEDTEGDTFEAADETLGDNRRRQDRLRELILDEQKIQEMRPALEVKQKQYERASALLARGAATEVEVERLRAEVGALTARVKDSDKIKQWKEQLLKLDETVVPRPKKRKAGSPIVVQMLARRMEVELQLVALDEEVSQLETAIGERRRGLGDTATIQHRADHLLKDLDTVEVDRQRLEGQLAALQQLRGPNMREFVVVAPATCGPHPVSSTRKLLFGGVLLLGTLLTASGLVLRDMAAGRHTGDEVALLAGIPELIRLRADEVAAARAGSWGSPGDSLRTASLRVRQHLTASGCTVLCSWAHSARNLEATLGMLCRYLAHRDERVLVVDTRIAVGPDARAGGLGWTNGETLASADRPATEPAVGEPITTSAPGLANYLTFECNDSAEIVRPTLLAGVDYIDVGTVAVPPDLLATHRMRELLEECRGRYSIVFLISPALTEIIDLEILAGHADGNLIWLERGEGQADLVVRFTRTMKELHVPLLRAVVCDGPSAWTGGVDGAK